MQDLKTQRAEEGNWPYIKEKLKKYLLDATNVSWHEFFIAKKNTKTVAFGRIVDHGDYFEIASLGVDYYHRGRGIGTKMLLFLIEEARRIDSSRPIYGVTHRPGFFKKVGFEETTATPEALKYKRTHKCKLDPSKIEIMRLDHSRRDG